MSLSNPRIIYGVHSIAPYRRSDRLPYGILKVIGSASLSLTTEQELLYAGSQKFPWASEAKTTSSDITCKLKAYPGFAFSLFLGATVTDVGVDAAGTVAAPANFLGTSVVASTGIASISVIPSTGAADLKFGKYLLVAASATTVNVYTYHDIDFNRGTDVTYVDDTLKVSGPHTITTGGNTDIASLGLRIVGGAGAIAMVTNDTASFEVKPPSTSSSLIKVGAAASLMPAFGAIFTAQQRSTLEIFEIEAYNVVASGLPISLEENAFSQPEVKMTCLYDSAKDGVFEIRHILKSS